MKLLERGIAFLTIVLVAAVVAAPGHALAAPHAAIVMDMRDGTVYHEDHADRRQHPASLTKMMTLYLTFEAVERGQLDLDQKVRISRHAARQPASKLYLKSGSRASIRHLIRAAAIKSANDAAMALAEAVGGSEAGFARLMNAKAQALGMRNSTFKNPHGLTQSGHLSTARDMAILARHLYFDFPDYYHLFSKRTELAYGKRIWTTNRLLGSYKGAEGMKTGYTRAAGYNLVGIASRGPERVIAVVLGGNSSRTRNAYVKKMLDLGFDRAPTRVAIVKPQGRERTLVASAPLPPVKPGAPATGFAAITEALSASPAVASTTPRGTIHAPLYATAPEFRGGNEAEGSSDEIAMPVPKPDWAVALGAFDDEAEAIALVNAVKLADLDTLQGAAARIEEVDGGAGKLYKVAFTGLDLSRATTACTTLRAHGRSCEAVTPGQ